MLEVCILCGHSLFPFELGHDSIHGLATRGRFVKTENCAFLLHQLNDRIVTKLLWWALLTMILQHILRVLDLMDFSALWGVLYENHLMNGIAPISREQIEVLL
jgi:hypothetical protein